MSRSEEILKRYYSEHQQKLGDLPDVEIKVEPKKDNIATIHCDWSTYEVAGVKAYCTTYPDFILIEKSEIERFIKQQEEISEFRTEILRLQNRLETYIKNSKSSTDALRRKKRLRQQQVLELYRAGRSIKEIIEETGFSKTSVYDYIKHGSELLKEHND